MGVNDGDESAKLKIGFGDLEGVLGVEAEVGLDRKDGESSAAGDAAVSLVGIKVSAGSPNVKWGEEMQP
ncbi:MAG: hypothetical protein V3V08_15705 [Nannocystaceae bacterium]